MQNRLILTLWLVGAVLYAGSTVFLAHAVLGGGSSAPDKAKAATVAAATDAKCLKDSVAAADAKPAKPSADQQKTAAIEPKKPAAAPSPAKPSAPETANSDSAALNPAPNSEQRSAETDQPSEDQPEPDTSSPDSAPIPDGVQQQDALGPDAGEGQHEVDQWAHVVAGTADMRSEPSMQAALIYALPSGWQVRVISRQPGWVQVQDANSGAAGWVESSAIAEGPGAGPGGRPGYGADQRPFDPYNRYAEEGYPYGQPPPPWRRPGGEFGNFLRRALGGW
ncbi:SH3 domain-containing protein [Methyloceanibacter sp.]|uniref:SH3 domain-containing protein n=1 Tax=Methyloceanibacter sp. TaxID=1965321 RepID=UPI003D6CD41F